MVGMDGILKRKAILKGVLYMARRRAKPKFWLFIMAIFLITFSFAYLLEGDYIDRQAEHVKSLQAEKEAALTANADLERKIAFADTPEYVERVAREDLGLLKPGQIRFVASGQ